MERMDGTVQQMGQKPSYLGVLRTTVMLADGLRDNVIILIAAGVDELLPPACQGI